MESWAANCDFDHVAFFCINVDTPDEAAIKAAKEFSTNLQLDNCYTGFFHKGYLPSFGQLGCSGFIISKPDGLITVAKTPPYLHYRDDAFSWMQRFFQLIREQQDNGRTTRAYHVTTIPTCTASSKSGSGAAIDVLQPLLEEGSSGRDTPPPPPPPTSASSTTISPATYDSLDQKNNTSTSNNLVLSITSMDEEHAECFEIIERVSLTVHDKQVTKEALQELYCHLQDHFDHEEHLMNQCKFGGGIGGQGWHGHRSDHERILSKISKLLDTEDDGTADSLFSRSNDLKDIISGLAQDLNNHIAQYDSLYVETFHEHGIK
jgi:hemerythrin-like metal-binding protein